MRQNIYRDQDGKVFGGRRRLFNLLKSTFDHLTCKIYLPYSNIYKFSTHYSIHSSPKMASKFSLKVPCLIP
jgi:hypothetical protein